MMCNLIRRLDRNHVPLVPGHGGLDWQTVGNLCTRQIQRTGLNQCELVGVQ
jgi:hypothetical protein